MLARKPPSAPLVVILGSTGTGKSELAVHLAVRFNGEIINADVMQMYKGLPIITNKISLDEQRSIPHHLLGNISLDEETWIVGVFKREANRIIREIRSRGRLPIVVGGTHYYTKALLFKDFLVASDDESTSKFSSAQDNSVEHPILEDTTEAMRKRLQEVDPIMADRWHPNDRRKIRRSLEIFLTTGRRASDIYAEQQKRKTIGPAEGDSEATADPLLFWVHTEKEALRDRLDRRVDKMLDTGLMDEITQMDNYLRARSENGDASFDSTRGIWQSIGFKEFQPYLRAIEAGITGDDLEKLKLDCLEKMKIATRQYAKYQMKWIPKQMMPLLKEKGSLDKLYVLDSTDVSQYSEQVTDKAAMLTENFLKGEDMAPPTSISDFAGEVLTAAERVASSRDNRCNIYCRFCDVTILTEDNWRKHIKGRAHQRKVRQSKRTALVCVEDPEIEDVGIEPNQDGDVQVHQS